MNYIIFNFFLCNLFVTKHFNKDFEKIFILLEQGEVFFFFFLCLSNLIKLLSSGPNLQIMFLF